MRTFAGDVTKPRVHIPLSLLFLERLRRYSKLSLQSDSLGRENRPPPTWSRGLPVLLRFKAQAGPALQNLLQHHSPDPRFSGSFDDDSDDGDDGDDELFQFIWSPSAASFHADPMSAIKMCSVCDSGCTSKVHLDSGAQVRSQIALGAISEHIRRRKNRVFTYNLYHHTCWYVILLLLLMKPRCRVNRFLIRLYTNSKRGVTTRSRNPPTSCVYTASGLI
jgi:hypothetical protein